MISYLHSAKCKIKKKEVMLGLMLNTQTYMAMQHGQLERHENKLGC
jgi:hypothetical protein